VLVNVSPRTGFGISINHTHPGFITATGSIFQLRDDLTPFTKMPGFDNLPRAQIELQPN